jgi:DnaJ-class molecular chaperone
MSFQEPDYYATLGLDRDCSAEDIRAAYRWLAKKYHPDVNAGSSEADARTRALNAAYEVLSGAASRKAYDHACEVEAAAARPARNGGLKRNLSEEVQLSITELLRGTSLSLRVSDPAQAGVIETHELVIPPGTAAGARFRLPRPGGGFLDVRVRVRPDARFRPRGSDLRCELRITAQRAVQGGTEMVAGPTGARLRVTIPQGVARGVVIRIAGEGLPKSRGGRGDLLVRVNYRVEVRVSRSPRR